MINYHWSRAPGKFVNKRTGDAVSVNVNGVNVGPKFTGSVLEWYETLVETCIDARNECVRSGKISAGVGPDVQLLVGRDVYAIFEATVLWNTNSTIAGLFTVKLDSTLSNDKILMKRGPELVATITVHDMNVV